MSWLDDFWADIMSEEPLRILAVWVGLDDESQLSVRDHLGRIATEDGWADVQRHAAQIALDVIENGDDSETKRAPH